MPLSIVFNEKRRQGLYTSGVVGGKTTNMGYNKQEDKLFIVKSQVRIVVIVKISDLI